MRDLPANIHSLLPSELACEAISSHRLPSSPLRSERCRVAAMEVGSIKSFFRVSVAFHHSTRHFHSQCKPPPRPRSNSSLHIVQALTARSDSGSPHVIPLCLILPILHSFGGFVLSRLPEARSWLRGGFDGPEGEGFLCSSGIGTLLMSTTAAVSKSRVSPFVWTLAGNPTFVSGLVAWSLAQSVKMFINFFLERRWDLGMLFSSGGMPSSHSALCTALTASVALCHGVGDSLFPVCLGFSLIVMYDAIGVRRHAGMQAQVLNKIIDDLFQGHPISERKLKELLGHTPSQVLAGAVLGILVAFFCCQGSLVTI